MKQNKSKLLETLSAVRNELYTAVQRELADETRRYKDIAAANGISLATVQRVAERSGISRPVGPRPRALQNPGVMNTVTTEKLSRERGQQADGASQEACHPTRDGGE